MTLFQIKLYAINILYSANRENFKMCSCCVLVVDGHSRYFKKTLFVLKLALRYTVYAWKPEPK